MTDAPRIEFPCRYPVKVMAEARSGIKRELVAVFTELTGPIADDDISERDSRDGNYVAITITFVAEGEPQLAALHDQLRLVNGVRLVL